MTPSGGAGDLGGDRLFCYGTLMTGFVRRPLLGPAVLEGRGRTRGILYDFGDYPGLVIDGAGRDGWVVGEVYHVPDLGARLADLDRAEWYDPADETRSLYLRRRARVERPDGRAGEAWLYVYNPAVGGPPERRPRVDSGDWRAHVSARAAGPR